MFNLKGTANQSHSEIPPYPRRVTTHKETKPANMCAHVGGKDPHTLLTENQTSTAMKGNK